MKRFVSYLYSIHNNQKIHNAGFARVELRAGRNRIDIHMRENGYSGKTGTVYLFIRNRENIQGISIGTITFRNNQADFRYEQAEENIGQTPWQIIQMNGILVMIDGRAAFLTQWDEQPVDTGRFKEWKEGNQKEGNQKADAGKKQEAAQQEPHPEQQKMQARQGNPENSTVPGQNASLSGNTGQEHSAAGQNHPSAQNRQPGSYQKSEKERQTVLNHAPARNQKPAVSQKTGSNRKPAPNHPPVQNHAVQQNQRAVLNRKPAQNQKGVLNQQAAQNQAAALNQKAVQNHTAALSHSAAQTQTAMLNQEAEQETRASVLNQRAVQETQASALNQHAVQENLSPARNKQPAQNQQPALNQDAVRNQREARNQPADLNQQTMQNPAEAFSQKENSMQGAAQIQQTAPTQDAGMNQASQPGQGGMPQMENAESMPASENRNPVQHDNQKETQKETQNKNQHENLNKNQEENQNVNQPGNQAEPDSSTGSSGYGSERQMSDIRTAELQPQRNNCWEQTWRRMLRTYPVLNCFREEDQVLCVRIEIKDVRLLPEKYWSIVNNSFLLHGFFSCRYLVFGRIRQKWFIGIPGIYQNQEHAMASIFGFPDFLPYACRNEQGEQAGCWYRILEI